MELENSFQKLNSNHDTVTQKKKSTNLIGSGFT